MGGIANAVANIATGGMSGIVQTAVSTVAEGVGSLAKSAGMGGIANVFDSIDKLAKDPLGTILGGLGGGVSEAGGMPDPLSFFGKLLPPGLGDVLGIMGSGGFDPMHALQGLAGGLLGGGLGGIVGNVLGGVLGGGLGNILGGLGGDLAGPGLGGGIAGGLGQALPGLTSGAGVLLDGLQQSLGNLPGAPPFGGNPNEILKNVLGQAKNYDPSQVLEGLKGGLMKLGGMVPNPSRQLNDAINLVTSFAKGGMVPNDALNKLLPMLQNLPELNQPFFPNNPQQQIQNPFFMKQFGQEAGGFLGQITQGLHTATAVGGDFLNKIGDALKNGGFKTLPFHFPQGTLQPNDPNINIAAGAGTTINIQGGAQITVNPDGSVVINVGGQAGGGVGATPGGGYPVGDPGFAVQGGGGAGASIDPGFNVNRGATGPTGAQIDPGFSPSQTVPTGAQTSQGGLESAIERNMDSMDSIMNQMQNIDPNSPDGQKKMMQLQQQFQKLQTFQNAMTQMLKQYNDATDRMIQTLGGR
jgi:hypothetical protein